MRKAHTTFLNWGWIFIFRVDVKRCPKMKSSRAVFRILQSKLKYARLNLGVDTLCRKPSRKTTVGVALVALKQTVSTVRMLIRLEPMWCDSVTSASRK